LGGRPGGPLLRSGFAQYLSMSHRQIFRMKIKKCDDVRSISQMNTMIFILVQILSKSNSHTSSLAVLCYEN
jgi:hypothetical protein